MKRRKTKTKKKWGKKRGKRGKEAGKAGERNGESGERSGESGERKGERGKQPGSRGKNGENVEPQLWHIVLKAQPKKRKTQFFREIVANSAKKAFGAENWLFCVNLLRCVLGLGTGKFFGKIVDFQQKFAQFPFAADQINSGCAVGYHPSHDCVVAVPKRNMCLACNTCCDVQWASWSWVFAQVSPLLWNSIKMPRRNVPKNTASTPPSIWWESSVSR